MTQRVRHHQFSRTHLTLQYCHTPASLQAAQLQLGWIIYTVYLMSRYA